MSSAAILLGSGQHLVANRRVREIAAQLQGRAHQTRVEPAFLTPGRTGNEPLLGDAVARLATADIDEIAVVPFMADWEYPELYDLPDLLYDLAQEFPRVRLYLGQTLSAGDDVVDVVADRLMHAWTHPDAGAATVRQIAEIAGQTPVTTATVPDGEVPRLPAHAQHLLVCFGRRCMEQGSPDAYRVLTAVLAERGLDTGAERVKVTRTKCLSPCAGAPVVCLHPRDTYFCRIDAATMPRFVDEVLIGHGTLAGHAFTAGG